ncbi:MAG: EF-hand domain-containing protein [Pseudomonadota bacterium]
MKLASLIASLTALSAAGFTLGVAIAQPPAAQGDRWSEHIVELDTDGDGAISKAESDARRAESFASADTNGDGVLSSEELTEFRASEKERRRSEKQGRMFSRLDTNDDGFVDAEEFAVPGNRRFERTDADGDGVITQAEAEEARANRPKRRRRGPSADAPDAG